MSISGIDTKNILNTLLFLNKSEDSNPSSNETTENEEAESANQDTNTQMASTLSLPDQLKILFLQSQCSYITSLLDSDDSSSSNALISASGNEESMVGYSGLSQLIATSNSSSADSSISNDFITNILQSLNSSSSSQNNSNAIQTAVEKLIENSGIEGNLSAQKILENFSSSNGASLIKEIV
ncbi:MAG: hypothetical protein ABFD50_00805 [Smithella sp.]